MSFLPFAIVVFVRFWGVFRLGNTEYQIEACSTGEPAP